MENLDKIIEKLLEIEAKLDRLLIPEKPMTWEEWIGEWTDEDNL